VRRVHKHHKRGLLVMGRWPLLPVRRWVRHRRGRARRMRHRRCRSRSRHIVVRVDGEWTDTIRIAFEFHVRWWEYWWDKGQVSVPFCRCHRRRDCRGPRRDWARGGRRDVAEAPAIERVRSSSGWPRHGRAAPGSRLRRRGRWLNSRGFFFITNKSAALALSPAPTYFACSCTFSSN
jgi:hypothetical protein